MLKIIDSLRDIDFRQLMDVYEEDNQRNGKQNYSDFQDGLQLIYAEQDFYTYLEIFFSEPTARYAVWIEGERYVSALRFERYRDGLLLNALETAPAARQKGYATRLICAVLDYLRSTGSGILYTHIEKGNLPSLSVHKMCGFSVIADQAEYLDGTARTDSYTLSIQY